MGAAYEKGLILYRQRRYADAAEQFRLELGASDRQPATHSMLALALHAQGDRAQAEDVAREALTLHPNSAFAHYALGFVLLTFHPKRFLFGIRALPRVGNDERLRQVKASLAEARQAVSLEPLNADFHELVALGEANRGKWRRCLAAAKAGLETRPTHEGCLRMRTLAMRQIGRTDAALTEARAGLTHHPESDVLHEESGWSLLELGDARGARRHFEESLRVNPGDKKAQTGLRQARRAERFFLYRVMLRVGLWGNAGGRIPLLISAATTGLLAGVFRDYAHVTKPIAFAWAIGVGFVMLIFLWLASRVRRRIGL